MPLKTGVFDFLEKRVLSQFDLVTAKHAERREIAAAFGLGVRTIEVHKAHIMEKMQVTRMAELILLFARADVLPEQSARLRLCLQ